MKKELISALCARFIRRELAKKFNIEHTPRPRPEPASGRMLYIHVPFCHTFCPYCSFHKFAYDAALCKRYFANLREELRQLADSGHRFETLYVGGGTTLIDEDELAETLALARGLFGLKEISAESDPTHLERLDIFDGLIDRLSVGVQSFDDEILQKTTRIKFGNGEQTARKLAEAKKHVKSLSIDLIFNFPGQSAASLERDIDTALSFEPGQITTYPLMKSSLTRRKISAAFGSAKDRELEFYEQICAQMARAGWQQNNAWSFSREASKFNDEYCSNFAEYIGAGSGAFSFANGELLINAFDLAEYEQLVKSGGCAHIARVKFSRADAIDYGFLTQFFSTKINAKIFSEFYEVDLAKHLSLKWSILKLSKAFKRDGDWLISTDFGKYLALVLMKEFYINMDAVRAYFKAEMEQKSSQNSGGNK